MRSLLAICFIFSVQLAIAQKITKIVLPPVVLSDGYPEFISACQVVSHKNELVYTRFIYSGVDEYWSLSPDEKCEFVKTELNIPDDIIVQPKYLKLLKKVHDMYWKKYLIIDLVGIFKDDTPSGYGHMGSNKAQFIVKRFVSMDIMTKTTQH